MFESYNNLITKTANLFRSSGYKKSRGFLYRETREGNLGFISFIDDRELSNKVDGITRFTVEVAVASKRLLNRFQGIYHFSKKPSPQATHYSKRIGFLSDYQEDHWWYIGPRTEQDVTTEVIGLLSRYGVPEIEREISDEAICCRQLRAFEQGQLKGIAYLNQLAFLLKEVGDELNFNKVAKWVYGEFGCRPFDSSCSVAGFLVDELGFSATEPSPPFGPKLGTPESYARERQNL